MVEEALVLQDGMVGMIESVGDAQALGPRRSSRCCPRLPGAVRVYHDSRPTTRRPVSDSTRQVHLNRHDETAFTATHSHVANRRHGWQVPLFGFIRTRTEQPRRLRHDRATALSCREERSATSIEAQAVAAAGHLCRAIVMRCLT